MILSVCKKFDFCYAHLLPEHEGKCKNHHGHNGVLEVELFQKIEVKEQEFGLTPGVYTGMLIDFKDLFHYVEIQVIEKIDHKFLNEVLPEAFLPPTAENMCRWIWMQLAQYSKYGDHLLRVRVYETPDSFAELKREMFIDPGGEKKC